MNLKKYLLYLALCFIPAQGHVTTLNKFIHYYDPTTDSVKNIPVDNVAYGCPYWSYEDNNRSNNDERAARFLPEDIVGCNLMDFGCNEGGVLMACRRLGAGIIIGIDINDWCVARARQKALAANMPHTCFLTGDMENKGLYVNLPQVDTVFLLAILDTSNFANKQAVLSNISRLAKKALYYEGHITAESHVKRMYELLVYTSFTRFEYLGRFDNRILMRCSREVLNANQLPSGAITSDHPDEILQQASEIYVFTDSQKNPAFGPNCRLIQYVNR